MSAWRRAGVMIGADVLERVRRSSFLAILASAVYLAYVVGTGKMSLTVGDCTGVLNGAWVGTAVSLTASTMLSLAGFYIVRGGLAYDRQSGVGEILRTTSLTPWSYMAIKAASAVFVLLAMVAVLMASAFLTLCVHHTPTAGDLWGLISPFVTVTVPAMAVVAALAVLFDAIPLLASGLGNVVYFFAWSGMLGVMAANRSPWDFCGLGLYAGPLKDAVRAEHPHANENFVLGSIGREVVGTFHWNGLPWTTERAMTRLVWCALAVALVLLAALVYRPEAFRRTATRPRPRRKATRAEPVVSRVDPATVRLRPLPAARHYGILSLVVAEVRLLLAGMSRGWALVALGLAVAGAVVPVKVAREIILPIAWLWPMLRLSSLGVRAAQEGVEPLLLATPRPVPRLPLASWLAGIAVLAALGVGVLARALAAGDTTWAVAWCGGVMLVPAAALALGAWSGTTRLFEAVYLVAWYIGPMNRVPMFDYSGATASAVSQGSGVICVGLAAGCIIAAHVATARRLRV